MRAVLYSRHGGSDVKNATDIAARAVCMGVVNFRARFESVRLADGAGATPDAAEMIAGVTSWLFDAGLGPSLLKSETAILRQPPNSWDRKILEALGDALLPESIGVLLASLGLVTERPPYDGRYDAEPLLRLLPFLSDSPFVTGPGMSPQEEWTAMATGVHRAPDADVTRRAGAANLWWWRAVSESLVRGGRLARRKLDGILRDGAEKARGLGIPYAADDFEAFGKPYSSLTPDEHRAVSAVAEARVRAYRFIQGDVAWDEVPMDS
jgi:hypothetical protein